MLRIFLSIVAAVGAFIAGALLQIIFSFIVSNAFGGITLVSPGFFTIFLDWICAVIGSGLLAASLIGKIWGKNIIEIKKAAIIMIIAVLASALGSNGCMRGELPQQILAGIIVLAGTFCEVKFGGANKKT